MQAAGGTAASFRMYDSSNNCHVQGNCSSDLVLNNTNIASGQTVTVTSFAVTAGNAKAAGSACKSEWLSGLWQSPFTDDLT
jgi:hypothetical protein